MTTSTIEPSIGPNDVVLETRRLWFREMGIDDIDDLQAIFCDPIAMQYYPEPFDSEKLRQYVEWNMGNFARYGFGLWTLIHKGDQRLVGDCGLSFQMVDGVGELEIGYHLLPSYWNRGLATEAASACRDYVFDRLERKRVISWMNPANVPSRRVAEKIGMHLEKETTNKHDRRTVVYAITSS